jgi:hypothetical protein
MVSAVPMSRSRGSGSGLALVLLGAWGGLAPFIGPYFHFGFEPDTTWFYSTGRLYASIIPGGVVLLTGLVVMATRSRWFGGLCAVIAALGGAWFVVGQAVLAVVANNTAKYSVGATIGTTLSRVVLTDLACFYGLGVLIVFCAALSSGRLSIGAYRDFLRFGDAATGAAGAAGAVGLGGLANVGLASPSPSYTPYQPTTAATFDPFQPPAAEQPIVGGQAKFPSQYPSAGEDTQSGAATNTFTPGQVTYSPGQTKYPPAQEQTNPLTAPTQEQKFPPAQR